VSKIIVIAPHPDDETLGCGGTLLKAKASGNKIYWLIVTEISEAYGYSADQVASRESEIQEVGSRYGFEAIYNLRFPTTRLDEVPLCDLIDKIGTVFKEVQPEVVYLPYRGDTHSDHAVVFDAAASCTKWFRYPSIKKVLVYETISETDFSLNPDIPGFRPNIFVDISESLEMKLEIMKIFNSETDRFPFPRSQEAVRAQAVLRGSASGCRAAEAFILLKEIS